MNSAHPFENPNPFTNLLETLAMVSIPAAMDRELNNLQF